MLKVLFSFYKKFFSKHSKNITEPKAFEDCDNNVISVEQILPFAEADAEILVTVTGISHYFGNKPFSAGDILHLIKEPGNRFDPFAVSVICENVGKCGYVANNDYTVKQGTVSARLLCGAVAEKCQAEVLWVDENFVLCKLVDIDSKRFAYNYGIFFHKNGDIKSALDIFECLGENTEDITVFQRACACCIELGYREKAEKYLEKAFSFDKENKITTSLKDKLKNIHKPN